MAKYREIRSRIQGVDNTAKITQAMKMVAAAKLRRAQDRIIAARPYGRKLRELLQFLASSMETAISPLLEEREIERVCLVAVASDRGLCGAFNSNLLKAAAVLIETQYGDLNRAGNLDVIAVGKRAVDFFTRRGYNVVGTYAGIFNALDFSVAQQIVNQVRTGFLERRFDRVDIIYNEFKTVAKQDIAVTQLLPIPKLEAGAAPAAPIDYIFEPSRGDILDALLPTHLNTQMWNALLESNAAEQGARMTAMENATRNAKDLVRELRRSYNKARQTAITTEILEIVSGAEALKSQ
jgi:F-type H+-transporting ATPase subunit gamma